MQTGLLHAGTQQQEPEGRAGWVEGLGDLDLQLDVVQWELGTQQPCSGHLVAVQRPFSGRAVVAE